MTRPHLSPRPFGWRCLCGWAILGCLSACDRSPPVTQAMRQRDQDQALRALARAQGALIVRPLAQPVWAMPRPRVFAPPADAQALFPPASLAFLRPVPMPVSSSASPALGSSLRDFLLRHRTAVGLHPAHTLALQKQILDAQRQRHFFYQVQHLDVPLASSWLVAHVDEKGWLVRVQVSLPGVDLDPPDGLDPRPLLTPEQARQAAREHAYSLPFSPVRASLPPPSLTVQKPALLWLPCHDGFQLAYRVEILGQRGAFPLHAALFVGAGARPGELLFVEDLMSYLDVTEPAQGTGIGARGTPYTLSIAKRGDQYSLLDPTRGDQRTTRIESPMQLPGKTVQSPDPITWDRGGPAAGMAVDVHAHVATLWDYFARQHGHIGFDGRGHGILAITHAGERSNLALFDGERLLFGDGDGQRALALGTALDVVAHEYAHAVQRALSGLGRTGESAALDEGFADLWACLIERSSAGTDTAWTLGEQILLPTGDRPPTPIADLATPQNAGQVAHVRDLPVPSLDSPPVDFLDQGLLRQAAGVVGHAGFLLAQRLGDPLTAQILFRAQAHYLPPRATLQDGAFALQLAAQDLGGEPAAQAVAAVFDSLGIHVIQWVVHPEGLTSPSAQ